MHIKFPFNRCNKAWDLRGGGVDIHPPPWYMSLNHPMTLRDKLICWVNQQTYTGQMYTGQTYTRQTYTGQTHPKTDPPQGQTHPKDKRTPGTNPPKDKPTAETNPPRGQTYPRDKHTPGTNPPQGQTCPRDIYSENPPHFFSFHFFQYIFSFVTVKLSLVWYTTQTYPRTNPPKENLLRKQTPIFSIFLVHLFFH